jgi:sec-independent protein translocase protein TatA
MFGISPQELLVILVVALIVVGPRKLPELGRSLGKGLREIRRAQDEVRKTVQVGFDEPEAPRTRAPAAPARLPEEDVAGGRPRSPGPPAGAAAAAGAGSVSEISKTLGRGLGELRRAKEEVERSFRVDLNEPSVSPTKRAGSTRDATDRSAGLDPSAPSGPDPGAPDEAARE